MTPPSRWCEPPGLADCRDPQAGTPGNGEGDAQPGGQRGSFGNPSTISPMMFRCTCDDPA